MSYHHNQSQFRTAAVTEGEHPPTVSFCSVAHFERPASTGDGRMMTCKEDWSHACHVTQNTIHTTECDINTHCSVGKYVVCVCAFVTKYSSRDTACMQISDMSVSVCK